MIKKRVLPIFLIFVLGMIAFVSAQENQTIKCYKNEDCGESFTKRYCSDSQACVSESFNYCLNPGTVESYCIGKGGSGCTLCAHGCNEGFCIEETKQQCLAFATPAPQPGCTYSPKYNSDGCVVGYEEICKTATCKDTDGGIDYYVKGSIMFGDKTAAVDSCEDGITLREGSCVSEPGTNEGTMTTSVYKCSNGCNDGACIKGEKQKEEVKCVFKNSKTEQKCHVAGKEWMYCSGIEACIVTNLEGYNGEKMTWKSSCGGYAYTTLDGNSEYAVFDCSGRENNFCQSSQCPDGSWTKCYVDSKGYCTCSSCQEIITKPVCGNKICESGEGQVCEIIVNTCEAGKECSASTGNCHYNCQEDCKEIEGTYAKLNEKFKLQVNQPVKITDYKEIKILFRELLTPKCEASTTNVQEIKEKLTGYATQIPQSVEIIKCPAVGPIAQLEIINPEKGDKEGKKILTLKQNEAKIVYGISISFAEYDFASRTGVFLASNKLLTCPENCKCDNEGYVLECKTEEKCEEGKRLCPEGDCKEKCEETSIEKCDYGCLYNNKCLPVGVRVKGLYCDVEGTLNNQIESEETCENNFECSSNVCISGKCVSSGLIQKIINWFKKLFG